jgi:hypothetical protein
MYRSKLVVHDGGNGDVVCTLSREVRIHDAVWTKSGHILAACDESKLVVWSADGACVAAIAGIACCCEAHDHRLHLRFIREVVTPHKFRVRNVSALTAESSVVTSDPEGLVLVSSLCFMKCWLSPSYLVVCTVVVTCRAHVSCLTVTSDIRSEG